MKLKIIPIIEIALFIVATAFAFLWIQYPNGKYEPYLVFIGFLFTGIEIYRRKISEKNVIEKKTSQLIMKEPQRFVSLPHHINFIDSIPEQRIIVYRNAKKLWDSGISANMKQGSYDVLDFLIDTWVKLAEFYPPNHFDNKQSREFISEYIEKKFEYFHSSSEIGLFQNYGTIEGVSATGAVNKHLETMIAQMVENITKNTDLVDFKSWEKKWKIFPL